MRVNDHLDRQPCCRQMTVAKQVIIMMIIHAIKGGK